MIRLQVGRTRELDNHRALAMTLSPAEKAHRYLRLASTLCYLQSVFLALSTVALGMPAFSQPTPPTDAYVFLLAFIAATIGFGIAGWSLRRFRRSGAFVALVTIGVEVSLHLAVLGSPLNVWLAVDLGIVALIALGWPYLEPIRSAAPPPAA
ncbi:MAG TPA: hypothetical protein VHL32_02905 [Gemmatimonadaceae bacterium]|jgi:hypothetical protein|nr:hypothetical protein [Gemmatimonadaceae bacterium]